MVRVLKRIKGKWYVYEVTTKYLGPLEKVGTKSEARRVMLNPDFFDRGRFRFTKELESIVKNVLGGERVKIDGIYVYGSQVTGRYSARSDLDVWVKVKPKREADEQLYSGPTPLTATRRMDDPPADLPKVKLRDVDLEICRSTLSPKPPYFDVRKQRLVGRR